MTSPEFEQTTVVTTQVTSVVTVTKATLIDWLRDAGIPVPKEAWRVSVLDADGRCVDAITVRWETVTEETK